MGLILDGIDNIRSLKDGMVLATSGGFSNLHKGHERFLYNFQEAVEFFSRAGIEVTPIVCINTNEYLKSKSKVYLNSDSEEIRIEKVKKYLDTLFLPRLEVIVGDNHIDNVLPRSRPIVWFTSGEYYLKTFDQHWSVDERVEFNVFDTFGIDTQRISNGRDIQERKNIWNLTSSSLKCS